jgi:site-specific DNA-cytosine methylase
MVQLSPPCVDFSVSGRCIEGRAAWLTVTAALLILDLGVPVLCIENVEQMAKAAAWDIARETLVDAGYVLEQVVVDAADCGVAQNRRRLFVAGARTGRTADRWAQSVVEHWADNSATRALPAIPRAFSFGGEVSGKTATIDALRGWRQRLKQLPKDGTYPSRSVREVLKATGHEVKKGYFHGARNGKAACIRDPGDCSPTLRTNRWWRP